MAAPSFGQGMNTLSAQERAQGWQLLFDGKTLAGWHVSAPPPSAGRSGPAQPPQPGQVGTPKPCVRRGIGSRGAAGRFALGNRRWRLERVRRADRLPDVGSQLQELRAVDRIQLRRGHEQRRVRAVTQENGGYEVQIWRQQPAGYNTGGIVGTAKTAREFTFKPNQWNRYQITADGDHLVVELNGETTLDIHDARFSEGHLRLQYQQFPIAFRNIKIRVLP
jgi:hypothetical protein